MTGATQGTVEEYLATSYQPDCDYVDGEVLERNGGERGHSYVHKRLTILLGALEDRLDSSVWPEVRVQMNSTRFRVPDVCVYRGPGPADPVFREPPFLSVEILSPEDRVSRMEEKLGDYFGAGVEIVCVIDPVRRTASVHTAAGSENVRDGILRTRDPAISLSLEELLPR
jgi:Uma2 family endonuclease